MSRRSEERFNRNRPGLGPGTGVTRNMIFIVDNDEFFFGVDEYFVHGRCRLVNEKNSQVSQFWPILVNENQYFLVDGVLGFIVNGKIATALPAASPASAAAWRASMHGL